MSDAEFAGKIAIVTGGTRDIGLAVARMLVERGACVVIVGRDQANLDVALTGLAADGAAVGCQGDIGTAATANAAVDIAIAHFGRIDIFANIAGPCLY